MTWIEKTVVLPLLAAATGVGNYEHHQAAKLRGHLLANRKQQASLTAQIQQMTRDYQDATNRLRPGGGFGMQRSGCDLQERSQPFWGASQGARWSGGTQPRRSAPVPAPPTSATGAS